MADDEDSTSTSANEDNPSSSENVDSASMANTSSDSISSTVAAAADEDEHDSRSPKRQKRGDDEEVKVEVAETKEDRISKLPDSVLRRILSFIPIKIAVGTCIFGKRWKNLWTSASNISLNDSFRLHPQNPVNVTSFMNFVDNVLNLHDPESPILDFSLECKQPYDPWRVKSWLFAIAELDVKDLELTFPLSHMLDCVEIDWQVNLLPSSFFNRAHLVKLNLSHIIFIVPNTVNFPSLKTLWLIRVQLLGEGSMMNLLSGCPVLWMLDVNRAYWDVTETYSIRSSTLAYLTLHADYCPRKVNTHRFVVDAPTIELLHLSGNLEYDNDFGDLSSLKSVMLKADKDGLVSRVRCEKDGPVSPGTCEEDGPVSSDTLQEDDEDSQNIYNLSDRLVELLKKISHVEDLYFYPCVVRFLEYASFENCPMFCNLTNLTVDIADNSWRILPPLLECSPNLVNLKSSKVFEGASKPDLKAFGWYPPPSVPKCLLSSLEIIEFKGFEYYNDEIGMIEYFLKNAMVLKKIYIKSRNLDLETQSVVLREILMFPRSSNLCRVVFS